MRFVSSADPVGNEEAACEEQAVLRCAGVEICSPPSPPRFPLLLSVTLSFSFPVLFVALTILGMGGSIRSIDMSDPDVSI